MNSFPTHLRFRRASVGWFPLIEVAHLDTPGTAFRVWMNRISDESVQFSRHTDPRWPGWFTGQIAAAHEVGHWLRGVNATHFDHIDWEYAKNLPPARRANSNSRPGSNSKGDGVITS